MRLLVVLTTLAFAGVVLAEDYKSFTGLNNTYNLHKERVAWDTANAVCALEGGHLLVINSNAEATVANLLFGQMPPFVPPLPWKYDLMHVGITDKAKEGAWRTVLGDLLTDSGFNVWRKGEPNNYGTAEHCGAIDRVGTFSDLRCLDATHICPFICEKEATVAVAVADPDPVADPNPDADPNSAAEPDSDADPATTKAYVDFDIDTKERL